MGSSCESGAGTAAAGAEQHRPAQGSFQPCCPSIPLADAALERSFQGDLADRTKMDELLLQALMVRLPRRPRRTSASCRPGAVQLLIPSPAACRPCSC